jgi:predicted GIY-YIG superfamily endonuclease
MEKPNIEGFLAFLDLEIKITTPRIEHRWFVKPIHSGNIIHATTNAPHLDKLNIISNMFHTAMVNSNTEKNIQRSITKMTQMAIKNGYQPKDIIKCLLRARNIANKPKKLKTKQNMENFIKIPIFCENQKRKITVAAKKFGITNITIIKHPHKKITDIGPIPKKYQKTSQCKKCILENKTCQSNHVVYKITCKICDKFYIGMTNNTMCRRFRQHIAQWKKLDEKNAIAAHFLEKHKNIVPSSINTNLEIIKRQNSNIITAINESKLIKKLKPDLNRKFEIVQDDFI